MKLLLTSGGVTNASIRDALVDLLGKPIGDSNALCIPTAEYGHPLVHTGLRLFASSLARATSAGIRWASSN
jgi:dipeptidase E